MVLSINKGRKPIFHSFYARQQGMTLIEIIVALAILSVVIMAGYSFHLFGMNSFSIGENQSDIQSSVRLATDYIVEKVRYADTVEILGSSYTVTPPDSDYNYIYIESGVVRLLEKGQTVPSSVPGGNTENVNYSLYFNITGADNNTLVMSIDGESKGKHYEIPCEVLLSNVDMIKFHAGSGAGAASGGVMIRYSTPSPPAPVIRRIELFPREQYDNQPTSFIVNVTTAFTTGTPTASLEIYDSTGTHLPIYDQSLSVYGNLVSFAVASSSLGPAGNYIVRVKLDGADYPYDTVYTIIPHL